MAFTLTWSPAARFDLWDIASYIADFNPPAATRLVQSVFDKVKRLSEFPESGRVVPEFNDPAIREIILRPCRIVYRLRSDDRMVEIARIWHAARETPEI